MLYTIDDTIVALSTPRGQGGIGVVRLSGPQAIAVVSRLFMSAGTVNLNEVASHTLHHGWFGEGENIVDEVMVGIMRGPRTYTGQDVAEISCHGGPVVCDSVVERCLSAGCRLAQPGEFTFRAYVNGKLDLSRAEAVAELIASKTSRAAAASLEQLKGGLAQRVEAWRVRIVELCAALEVALDYGEEDIRFLSNDEMLGRIAALSTEIAGLIATAQKGKYLREGVKVAIVGKPNAGKSSLLNALLERERSIVTDIPGTTRDVIEETLDCRGLPLVIMDTAGLRRHTHDPVEKIGQERTVECLKKADVCLWVLDVTAPLDDADRHVAELISQYKPALLTLQVFNKIDGKKVLQENEVTALLPFTAGLVRLSAATRQGIEQLEDSLISAVDTPQHLFTEPLAVNARHSEALRHAADELAEAAEAIRSGHSEEIPAFHLRAALDHLAAITGATATDEILGTIFSKFCVGK